MVVARLKALAPGEFAALASPMAAGPLPDGAVASLLQALPVGVTVFDAQLRYRHVNAAMLAISGGTAEDRVGKTIAQVSPESAQLVEPVMRQLIAQRRTLLGWQLATASTDAETAGREVVADFHPILNASGEVTGLISLVRDVGGELRAMQAIRSSEFRLRRVLDSLFVFVGVMMPDGTLVEANNAPLEAGGLTSGEVLNRKFWDTPWWNYNPDVQAKLRAAVARAAAGESMRFDVVARMAGDSRMTLDFMLAPMRDDAGRITHLIPSAIDITARQAGEEALRRSEARFRQVVEAAPDGMAMVNAQGRLVLVNSAMERLFGWRREELLGLPVEDLMPEAVRAAHPGWLAAYFRAPQARDMAARRELFALRRDGALFPVEIGLNPIDVDGVPHTLATIVDVTQRKADRAMIERSLAEKTSLLQEVHHRVKNNLQVISSLLSLQASHLAGNERAALDESRHRVQAMALIHQLLYERNDFSGAALAPYLTRLCGLLRESSGRPGVSLRLNVVPPADAYALDIERAVPCGLLVNELVTNALKHAFPEGRSGTVDVGLRLTDEGICLLTVDDDGIGLPDGVLPGDTTTLGLQLVWLLTDQLGGSLRVRAGPGAHFEIHMPQGLTP